MINRVLDIRSEDHAEKYDPELVQRAEKLSSTYLPDGDLTRGDTIDLFGNYFP